MLTRSGVPGYKQGQAELAMKLADLTREGHSAFPPAWQDPLTGAEPLRDEPLAGVLVAVEWGPHDLSLNLTNYWRGRRLTGRLVIDNARLLPAVHTLLVESIPRHLDELAGLEVPAVRTGEPIGRSRHPPPAAAGPVAAAPGQLPAPPPALHPDLAALIRALVKKGLLTPEDLEAARRELDQAAARGSVPSSPLPRPG